MARRDAAGKARVVRHVPAEVCVVLAPKDGAALPQPLLQDVGRQLTQAIRQVLGTLNTAAPGAFSADLGLNTLKAYLRAGGALQPLAPPARSPGQRQAIPDPEVRLASRGGATETALLFYRFAGVATAGDREQIVRQFVNAVNMNLDAVRRALGDQSWILLAATPNWLNAAAQDFTGGGPGAAPEPPEDADGPDHRFDFTRDTNKKLLAELQQDKKAHVIVAVLDTSPSASAVSHAATRYNTPPLTNHLLQDVAGHLATAGRIDGPLSVDEAYFDARFANPATNFITTPAHFEMPDHGLFAAGIIYDITGQFGLDREIHLIRVLGKYGVGDLWALTAVLSQLPAAFLHDRSVKLVVNMSLMADVPPGVSLLSSTLRRQLEPSLEFLEYWFPNTTNNQKKNWHALLNLLQNDPTVADGITRTHVSLQRAIDWLSGQGSSEGSSDGESAGNQQQRQLLVAAAGNDGLRQPRPLQTRLPARYDDVLGVAAVVHSGAPSRYSNQGDEERMGDGVATFGGNARDDGPGRPPRLDGEWVYGVFTADPFPATSAQNNTGWARWAGTSFATPIISGIASCLWGAYPGLGFRDVINKITGLGDGYSGPLRCPVIRVYQTET